MTSCTRPGNNTRVTEFGTTESLCRVTRLTPQLSRQVLLRLHHIVSSQPQTAGVTTRAIARCAFQYTAVVARLTTYRGMRAGQSEPCLQVIEIGALDLRLQANSKGHEKDDCKNPNKVHIRPYCSKSEVRSRNIRPRSLRLLASHGMW